MRKIVKNGGSSAEGTRMKAAPTGVGSGERVSPSPVGVGSGAPEKFIDFVLRNVELLCILVSGAGR